MDKINDILHLYLGCECKDLFDDDIKHLHGVKENMVLLQKNAIHQRSFEEVKPILRNLSDMTEEEKREVQCRYMAGYANLSFTHEQMHNKRVGQSFYYAEIDEEGNFICSVSSPIENLPFKSSTVPLIQTL